MGLKQLIEQRVSANATGESLRPLSAQEVQQVAGALYYSPIPGGPISHGPGLPGTPGYPFPPELMQNV